MQHAINPQTREVMTALAYRRLDEDARPGDLVCPGHAPDATPCGAIVYPCALTSTKMAPYFRVESLNDHINDCSEITGDLTTINKDDLYLVGIVGQQGPTGPHRVISVTFKHSTTDEAVTSQTDGNGPQHDVKRLGHHRASVPRSGNTPTRVRAGLRKLASDHAAGAYEFTDEIRLTNGQDGKGLVGSRIFNAEQLINAPFEPGPIITYGRIARIAPGKNDSTFFIRLALPDGRKTKVSIMVRREQIDVIRQSIDFDAVTTEPNRWQIVALGSIHKSDKGPRYLAPHDAYSIELEAASPDVIPLT